MGGTTIGAVASCISQSSVGDETAFLPRRAPPFHVGVSACLSVQPSPCPCIRTANNTSPPLVAVRETAGYRPGAGARHQGRRRPGWACDWAPSDRRTVAGYRLGDKRRCENTGLLLRLKQTFWTYVTRERRPRWGRSRA